MKHLLLLGIIFAAVHVSYSIPEFCQYPENEGDGTHFLFAFFYDPARDLCNPFIYKGNGGNANRFENERQCIRNCSANAENVYPMEASKACSFKKASGECGSQLLRYYYDSAHDKCKKFIWTGCIGNGNRFTDMNICNTTCAGIHVDGDELEEDEPDTPIAIICGVLLAVIIVAILVTVIVLTVQSKKKKSSKKAPKKVKEARTDAALQDQGIELA
ncbi:BPTI/Kunitz domain-containing protein [Solea solea]|uniref:BPTI/Kunitz domain-containing protein n=1 Tax=Solea solea TaxID=90069 RepID=UPI00272B71A3|nr:BPTI/Kunitz domain-containing protein [Solea solea]